ncbi:NuA4 histone H4 acetyltransferase complex and the SWR1 complex subunit [Malassezia psittaci]|uniref:Protein AF-9 homolog n=1 Tax=Malassezia psittaci TaxID=1821823 RepID=A0AAF0F7S3_9BASI|nr:NuA4 histone H4 acetyltransferase complex and the SWR1 complex subunit [Malassezia psittaci]
MAKRMRGLVISRPILIGSTATPLTPAERLTAPPDHTHRWTVAVRSAATEPLTTFHADNPNQDANQTIGTRLRDAEIDLHKAVGGKDDLSYFIKRVQFRLHDTYTQPTRSWGEFEIQIKIFFVSEAGEKPLTTVHHLKLHPWPSAPVGNTVAAIPGASEAPTPAPSNPAEGGEAASKVTAPLPPAVHSWQYDEIVFPEPLETFYEILIAHPPTPWPATCAQAFANESDYHAYRKARDAQEQAQPPHPVHTPTGHIFEALALEAQQAEADRIDLARANAVQQLDKKRAKLIETEKLLRDVRAELRAINPSLAEPAVIT